VAQGIGPEFKPQHHKKKKKKERKLGYVTSPSVLQAEGIKEEKG
jgi:hypothetical protein